MVENRLKNGMSEAGATLFRFGVFEIDVEAEQLRKSGRTIRLQPQPFKLLRLLVTEAGRLVTREEIRAALWTGDTFVDFDQGVNFAIKQVREALDDVAERPVYIQTVPKRGYRFLAPVEAVGEDQPPPLPGTSDLRLHKALWANIVELRLAEEKRKNRTKIVIASVLIVVLLLAAILLIKMW
jgi:DNA-binding winged helix-turn-helix (wHTH) protein